LEEKTFEFVVCDRLSHFGLHLAVAESCTGGLIGHLITNAPGSSDYFLGGVIAYSNQTKVNLLGVQKDTLMLYGAVSEETVLEMARGARKILGADIGLAVSGIAGPGGGTLEKPVGFVWIGLSAEILDEAWQHQFCGDRQEIKNQAAEHSLHHLVNFLNAGMFTEENGTR